MDNSNINEIPLLIAISRLPTKERVAALKIYLNNEDAQCRDELLSQKIPTLRRYFRNNETKEEILKLIDKVEKQKVKVLTIKDQLYPAQLRNIYDPPAVLYYLGELNPPFAIKPRIAIVGSRQADKEGVLIAEDFANTLAGYGACIVSGLALGIDAAAHRGAISLNHGKSTIAVLGNALPSILPNSNSRLGKEILESGGIIFSQFEPGSNTFPSNFIDRNRVIAGLSLGVLVVQAVERSGSLVTARYALEEGREVMVIPGSIKNHRYNGSNKIIKDGAIVVTKPIEILEALQLIVQSDPEKIDHKIDAETVREFYDVALNEGGIGSQILKILSERGSMLIEELKMELGSPIDFSTKLLELELSDAIVRLPGNQITALGQ